MNAGNYFICGQHWLVRPTSAADGPGRVAYRPFPAVFGVLTGGYASGGYCLYYVASPIRL